GGGDRRPGSGACRRGSRGRTGRDPPPRGEATASGHRGPARATKSTIKVAAGRGAERARSGAVTHSGRGVPAPPAASVLVEGPWTHREVSANGGRLHIAEAGAGPLVLLLHGL